MASIIYYALIIALVIAENLCNNVTGKYNTMHKRDFQTRQNRFLSFNTQTNGDINMELAFNVPFITIPVKKSIDMAQGAIANLNVGAVVLAGAMAFGFAVIIPGILLLMSKKSWDPIASNFGYRSEDSQLWGYLNVFDQLLAESNIDTTSCMQRAVCWVVQNSAENVMRGQSSSSDKIIDGLATSKWLLDVVDGTVVHSALKNGLARTDCSKRYSQCKISERSIQMLTRKLANRGN